MVSKFHEAIQLAKLGFYPNYLDSTAFILTILLKINQMLVSKDPVHRPQGKMEP